jgi:hypothetical protein
MLHNKAKFIFIVITLLTFAYNVLSNIDLKTVDAQKLVTNNEDAKFLNILTYYPSPHPERNVKTAHSLQLELSQITTTCATRATVNLTYSCNNFLVSYQSVLNKFFHTNIALVTLTTLPLPELEKKVDDMLLNCDTIECYNKVGLFNTQINQLFIDKAEDLLLITGQQVLMDKFAAA